MRESQQPLGLGDRRRRAPLAFQLRHVLVCHCAEGDGVDMLLRSTLLLERRVDSVDQQTPSLFPGLTGPRQ